MNEEKKVDYVRCPKCSTVYEAYLDKCPSCDTDTIISEGLVNETIFNLND